MTFTSGGPSFIRWMKDGSSKNGSSETASSNSSTNSIYHGANVTNPNGPK